MSVEMLPLSARCALAVIDSGNAAHALATGALPVMALAFCMYKLPEATRDDLFRVSSPGHYRDVVLRYPALYAMHKFTARNDAELEALPRDIKRLQIQNYNNTSTFALLSQFAHLIHLDQGFNRIGS